MNEALKTKIENGNFEVSKVLSNGVLCATYSNKLEEIEPEEGWMYTRVLIYVYDLKKGDVYYTFPEWEDVEDPHNSYHNIEMKEDKLFYDIFKMDYQY